MVVFLWCHRSIPIPPKKTRKHRPLLLHDPGRWLGLGPVRRLGKKMVKTKHRKLLIKLTVSPRFMANYAWLTNHQKETANNIDPKRSQRYRHLATFLIGTSFDYQILAMPLWKSSSPSKVNNVTYSCSCIIDICVVYHRNSEAPGNRHTFEVKNTNWILRCFNGYRHHSKKGFEKPAPLADCCVPLLIWQACTRAWTIAAWWFMEKLKKLVLPSVWV